MALDILVSKSLICPLLYPYLELSLGFNDLIKALNNSFFASSPSTSAPQYSSFVPLLVQLLLPLQLFHFSLIKLHIL